MNVSRDDLVSVFEAMGQPKVADLSDDKLRMKAKRIDLYRDDFNKLNDAQIGIVADIRAAVEAEEPINVTGGTETPKAAKGPKAAKAKKPLAEIANGTVKPLKAKKAPKMTKYGRKVGKLKVVDQAKLAHAAVKEAKKASKAKPSKNGVHKPETRPGVQKTIVKILQGASKSKPLSKRDVLAKLAKAFPDRQESSMWNTVNSQIPYRLTRELGVSVEGSKAQGGFWIAEGKAAGKGKSAKATKAKAAK